MWRFGAKHFNDSKALTKQSNDMVDIYENIEEYSPNKKREILMVFDDMVADMLNNKNLNPIVTELFIWGRKLKISLVFITQCYFAVLKSIRINFTHYYSTHYYENSKQKRTSIPVNYSSDIDSKDFMSGFRKNLLERI